MFPSLKKELYSPFYHIYQCIRMHSRHDCVSFFHLLLLSVEKSSYNHIQSHSMKIWRQGILIFIHSDLQATISNNVHYRKQSKTIRFVSLRKLIYLKNQWPSHFPKIKTNEYWDKAPQSNTYSNTVLNGLSIDDFICKYLYTSKHCTTN